MDNAGRLDEFDVDIEDTAAVIALQYGEIINSVSETLDEEDKSVVQKHRSSQDLMAEIRQQLMDPEPDASLRNLMNSVQPLLRSMAKLNGSFLSAVSPQDVQFDFLWGMVYLNLKFSYPSMEKLERTAEWLGKLRRIIELFNRCLNIRDDLNEPQLAMILIYSHVLTMLGETLQHLRSCPTDAEATEAWPQINTQLQQHFAALDSTVRHLNEVTSYSKVNLQRAVENLSVRYAPAPETEEYATFPCIKLPFQQNEKFFGREAELKKIIDHLSPKEGVSKLRTYTIYGRRGVGKTEIALQYAFKNPSGFDAIFWIQCETSMSLRQSFTEIAVCLKLPGADSNGHDEENLLIVQKWLKLTKKNWLLIFDNAEQESLLASYWPVGAKGAILITSRKRHNFMKDSQRKGDTIKPLNEQQSFDLLMLLLGENWQNLYQQGLLHQSEINAAKTLLKKLGGLVLAIQQAALLINDPNIGDATIAGTLGIFNSNAQRLPERPDTERSEIIHALDTLWNMNFSMLTPNARNLLSVLAMLSPDSMLIDLFLPKRQSALSGKLSFIQQEHRKSVDDTPSSPANVIIPPLLEAALGELLEHGLIKRDQRVISVHRVVQEAMNYHSIEDLQAAFDAAVSIVYQAFPKAWTGDILYKKWPICQTYISHGVHICLKYIDYTNPSSRAHIESTGLFTALMANCGWYLYETGDYDTCLKLVNTASTACEDKNSIRYANLRNTAGACYFDMNRLQDCRRDYEIALAIQHNESDHDDVKVSYMLHNMGNLETGCGKFEKARDYYTKAIDMRIKQGDRGEGQLALTYLCVGRLCYFQKMYDEAMKYLASSEKIFVRTSGADAYFMAFVHFIYGSIKFATENLQGAEKSYNDALKIALAETPIHFITSTIYYRLGCVELARNNHEAAKNYLENALAIAELRSPSRDDGTIARILFKMAKVLKNDPQNEQTAQDLLARAGVARLTVTGMGQGHILHIIDENGNVGFGEEDDVFDKLVPIFFR